MWCPDKPLTLPCGVLPYLFVLVLVIVVGTCISNGHGIDTLVVGDFPGVVKVVFVDVVAFPCNVLQNIVVVVPIGPHDIEIWGIYDELVSEVQKKMS